MFLPISSTLSLKLPSSFLQYKKHCIYVYSGSRNFSAIIHSSQYKMATEIRRKIFFPAMTLHVAHRCEIAVKNREQGIMDIKITETQLID